MSVTSDAYCQCEPKSSIYATRGLEPCDPSYGDQVFLTLWRIGYWKKIINFEVSEVHSGEEHWSMGVRYA